MLKKIGIWVLIAGFSGLLIWGAINRMTVKDNSAQNANGTGKRYGNQTETTAALEPARQGEAGSRWGRNNNDVEGDMLTENEGTAGRGQGQAGKGNRNQSSAAALTEADHPDDWEQLLGEVVSVNEDALELALSDVETLVIEGQSWRYAQELGFSAQIGDIVSVFGYLEDGEFRVGTLENTENGQTVVLREQSGRPIWAGGARGRSGA